MVLDLKLKVAEITEETPDIRRFTLVAAEGGDLPAVEAGAHVEILTGAGWRSYSIANDPRENNRYVTGVLREAAGRGGSAWMHASVKAGDVLVARGPANDFRLDEDAKRHILIAGGIGITPILAMGYRLKALGANFHLHYCTKSRAQTAFTDEVETVFAGHVTFHHDNGDPAKGINLERTLAAPRDGDCLYICGPAGLLNAAREHSRHWPAGTVRYELFASARTEEERAAVAALPNDAFEIELRRTGKTLTVPPEKSILQVLLEHGVFIHYDCEEGWCGSCEVPVIAGTPDHRDEVLSDEQKASGTIMQVCISRAKPGERLVLDL